MTLVNEEKSSGSYSVQFPPTDSNLNASLPSGIYFYTVKVGEFAETKKMILIK
ncbi:MAG: T9SS type A sorting domain-containing protein [Ignavibacteriaceae bacterium]